MRWQRMANASTAPTVGQLRPARNELARLTRNTRRAEPSEGELDRLELLRSLARWHQQTTLERPSTFTSVEIELGDAPAIFQLLQLDDANIAGLLNKGRAQLKGKPRTPELRALKGRFEQTLEQLDQLAREQGRAATELTWDEVGQHLGPTAQRTLLGGATAGSDFFRGRALPLVGYAKGERRVQLAEPVEIDGQVYRDRLPEVFSGRPEYMEPGDAKGPLTGLEVHLTRGGRAGRNATLASKLNRALQGSHEYLHQHIVNRLMARLRRSGDVALESVDHLRRINLRLELDTVELGGQLQRVEADGGTDFGYFVDQDYQRQLLYRRQASEPTAGAKVSGNMKLGAVGWRTGIYRSLRTGALDKDLSGDEVRDLTVPKNESPRRRGQREAFLNSVQRTALSHEFGLGHRAFRRWAKEQMELRGLTEQRFIGTLSYNRPIRALVADAPPHLQERLQDRRVLARLTELSRDNAAIKMLMHDWSRDSFWLAVEPEARLGALRRIAAAQLRVIDFVVDPPVKTSEQGFFAVLEGLAYFARASRLKELIDGSLGTHLMPKR